MERTISEVRRDVEQLRDNILGATPTEGQLEAVHEVHRRSVENLAHFVALRGVDLRSLQDDLSALGLSSLGRSEAHVAATVDAVVRALQALDGEPSTASPCGRPVGFESGPRTLERKTHELFGPSPKGRTTRIMVTMPTQAADDPDIATRFVQAGMDVARINCAHDDLPQWSAMAMHVRTAASRSGRDVRVLMDLAGPKLRTGPMTPGPAVVKVKPHRDVLGRVLAPGRVALVSADATLDERADGIPLVPVSPAFMAALAPGMRLRIRDARDSNRSLDVVEVDRHLRTAVAETTRSIYLTTGTTIDADQPSAPAGEVGELQQTPGHLTIAVGQVVELVGAPCHGETLNSTRVRVGCTLPEAVGALEVGHRVFFDDGTFGGVVEAMRRAASGPPVAEVRITSAPLRGGKLRAEKGINVPDTEVPVPALTERDLVDLRAAANIADMVALSFVRNPDDVLLLQEHLAAIDASSLGVVLKIETVQAFRQLPRILETAMRTRRVGVMIARGDLAVEAGYERLAEVQEEILWLCEAAHLPVIWATEVLDQLARTGRPSRSEITDAAMSERAECVMLNKGPHVVEAILTLHDILHRMAEHQSKKRHLMRPLRSWSRPGPG